MAEHHVQINIRVNSDLNFSHKFIHMLDTEEEAAAAGASDAVLLEAYARSYAEEINRINQEREDQ